MFAKTRKHIATHRTYYAFCAGSIVTSSAIIFATRDLTLLQVTKDQLKMLKEGTGLVYEIKGQTLHLVNIPAVQAATENL